MSDGSIYLFNGKYQQIKIPDQTPPGPAPAIRAITGLAVDKIIVFGQKIGKAFNVITANHG